MVYLYKCMYFFPFFLEDLYKLGIVQPKSKKYIYIFFLKFLTNQNVLQYVSENFPDGPSGTGFTALLKASYSEGANAFIRDSFKEAAQEALNTLHASQFPVAVNQVLLYLRNFVLTFNSVFSLSDIYLNVFLSRNYKLYKLYQDLTMQCYFSIIC